MKFLFAIVGTLVAIFFIVCVFLASNAVSIVGYCTCCKSFCEKGHKDNINKYSNCGFMLKTSLFFHSRYTWLFEMLVTSTMRENKEEECVALIKDVIRTNLISKWTNFESLQKLITCFPVGAEEFSILLICRISSIILKGKQWNVKTREMAWRCVELMMERSQSIDPKSHCQGILFPYVMIQIEEEYDTSCQYNGAKLLWSCLRKHLDPQYYPSATNKSTLLSLDNFDMLDLSEIDIQCDENDVEQGEFRPRRHSLNNKYRQICKEYEEEMRDSRKEKGFISLLCNYLDEK